MIEISSVMEIISLPEVFIYTICLGTSAICFLNSGKLNRAFVWLGVFLLFAGLSQITATILVVNFGTNLEFYNCVTLINIVLIYFIFISIRTSIRTKKWLRGIFSFGFIFTAAYVWYGLSNNQFSIRGLASMSVTVAISALVVLFGMLRSLIITSPLKMGWFWLLMGFLFYYTSTFSYWTAINFLKEPVDTQILQNVNVVLIIVFYLILLTAVLTQLKFGDKVQKLSGKLSRKPRNH